MGQNSVLKGLVFTGLILACIYSVGQWKVKSNLDRMIKSNRDFIDMTYSNVELTFAGSVVIKNSQIFIPMLNADISIEQLEYSSGGLFDMLFVQHSLENATLPENLIFRYKNARLLFTPALVQMLTQLELATQRQSPSNKPSTLVGLTTLGCGEKTQLTINDYIEMGYNDLNVSGEFNLNTLPTSTKIISLVTGNAVVDITNISHFEYQWRFSNVSNALSQLSTLKIMPTLDWLSLDIRDTGYNNRKNIFCAQQENTDITTYIDNHIALVADALSNAELEMTAAIQDKYRELLQPGSTIHLSVKPQPGFIFANIMQYSEEELRDILGLKIKVNNFDLPKLFTEWELEKFEEVVVLTPAAIAKKQERKIYKYVEKPLKDAQRYIRKQVKIDTVNGLEFEGMLNEVDTETLRISVFHQSGKSIGPIAKNRIKHFYIYE